MENFFPPTHKYGLSPVILYYEELLFKIRKNYIHKIFLYQHSKKRFPPVKYTI